MSLTAVLFLFFCQATTAVQPIFSNKSHLELSPVEFSSFLGEQTQKVREFQFIRQEAQKRGLRVWLFGGTATAFAYYNKWDLLRKNGDNRYQEHRFNYHYYNIFRSTQDLDIVVDGSIEQVEQFEQLVRNKFNYMSGTRPIWELRALRHSRGSPDKPGFHEALLNDPDFLNQHTDSNSTGMIEITVPPEAELPVKDLRDWKSAEPNFLLDVKNDEIHFYFSEKHFTTARAKAGNNPPIFSVIRSLTKAFQYEAKIRAEDLSILQKIINDFDPSKDMQTNIAKKWIERNGKKLINHAVNVEYAIDVLDQLGLRKKLIGVSDSDKIGSMGWWLNKEPLRSTPFGEYGATAAELGITHVAHETSDFLAYESLTRAHTGEPNVLISRPDVEGEDAGLGPGFYVLKGNKGARGTGFTIRFEVNPLAREGIDFIRKYGEIVFKNKKALRVIPESLSLSFSAYFNTIVESKSLSTDDRGIIEKFKLVMKTADRPSRQEVLKASKAVIKELKKEMPNTFIIEEWYSLIGINAVPEVDRAYQDLMEREANKTSDKVDWAKWIQWIQKIFKMNKNVKLPSSQSFEKRIRKDLDDPNKHWAIATSWFENVDPNGVLFREILKKISIELQRSTPDKAVLSRYFHVLPWYDFRYQESPELNQIRSFVTAVKYFEIMDNFDRYFEAWSPFAKQLKAMIDLDHLGWNKEDQEAIFKIIDSHVDRMLNKEFSENDDPSKVYDPAYTGSSSGVVEEWAKNRKSLMHVDLAIKVLKKSIRGVYVFSNSFLTEKSTWVKDPQWVHTVIGDSKDLKEALRRPEVINMVYAILDSHDASQLLEHDEIQKLLEIMLTDEDFDSSVFFNIRYGFYRRIPKEKWSKAMDRILKGSKRQQLIDLALKHKHQAVLSRADVQASIAEDRMWSKIAANKKDLEHIFHIFGEVYDDDDDDMKFSGVPIVSAKLLKHFQNFSSISNEHHSNEYLFLAIQNAAVPKQASFCDEALRQ